MLTLLDQLVRHGGLGLGDPDLRSGQRDVALPLADDRIFFLDLLVQVRDGDFD